MTTTTSTTNSAAATSIVATLGAGSGLDTASLVTNLVAASRQAKDRALAAQGTKVASQISGLSSLKSAVTVFSSSLATLVGGGSLSTQPESSDGAVLSVSAIAGQSVGAVSSAITVSQLAAPQSVASATIADADTAIGTGQLTFTFGNATVAGGSMTGFTARSSPAAITLTIDSSNDTLNGVASAINARNAGLTATVVTDSRGARLVVKGASGADAAFTIGAAEDAGAPGLSSLSFGPNVGASTLTQAAQNAILSYDGLAVTRSTNAISDLVPGVKLSLKAVSASAVTVSAVRPTTAVTQAVTDFVNAYNSLQVSIAEETDRETGPLNGDSSIRQMQAMLAKLTSTNLRASGHPATLAEIGVSTNRDGTLSLDTAKLSVAISTHPDEVEAMFNPTQASSSALVRIVSLTGASPAGTHVATDLVPATPATMTGGATTGAFDSPLVLTSGNNAFQVALDGGSAVTVTVPAGSYADGASFAAALGQAIEDNGAITVHATVGWNAGTGTLSAASKTLGSLSGITVAATDGDVNARLGLSGATFTRGANASGTIDGKPAIAVGSLLFASSASTAAGLVLQPLAGASSATIDVDLGLNQALANIVSSLTASSGALYTANARLTKQQTTIADQKTRVDDESDALKSRLTQQFAAMDAKVAAYKNTQAFLTQQIDAWTKSDS